MLADIGCFLLQIFHQLTTLITVAITIPWYSGRMYLEILGKDRDNPYLAGFNFTSSIFLPERSNTSICNWLASAFAFTMLVLEFTRTGNCQAPACGNFFTFLCRCPESITCAPAWFSSGTNFSSTSSSPCHPPKGGICAITTL